MTANTRPPRLSDPPLTLESLRRLMGSAEPVPEIRACILKWLPDDNPVVQWHPIRTAKPPHRMVTLLFVHPLAEATVRVVSGASIRWVEPEAMVADLDGFNPLPLILRPTP